MTDQELAATIGHEMSHLEDAATLMGITESIKPKFQKDWQEELELSARSPCLEFTSPNAILSTLLKLQRELAIFYYSLRGQRREGMLQCYQ